MIDSNKPTAMMLGRWQPWHQGHQMLFEKTLEKTGQVIIMVRDTPRDDSNPFDFETVKGKIKKALVNYKDKFDIIKVPNITNICYGRGVGYKIEEIVLPKEIQNISATKIRKEIINEN
jgi:phosphopantetheine adenylyltransferase